MKITALAPMPMIQRLEDRMLYVFPTRHAHIGWRDPEEQITHALAGPFPDRYAAARWIVGYCEARLPAAQLPVWAECLARAGGLYADPFQLIGLLMFLLEDAPAARVLRCAGQPMRVDRKALAAGETLLALGARAAPEAPA